MEAISASLQNPNLIPNISHSSGPLSATTVEIPNPASVSVEERQRGENGLKITNKQVLTVFSLRYLDYPKMLSKRLNLKLAASWSKRRYTRLQHVIFELEASELVGSINRPRAWTAFRAYGFELTEVLSNLTDWKVNMVSREAKWGAFLIARSVTKEMRLPSYVAQGSPSWLQGLLAEEGTRNR
ncbi:unnamed protein product [Brassica oleracea var. botrytis]|uniref:Uncharacterized protein n=3 Tax=Brassica TaxID=3705 RepID=A0A3P6F282_BRAOL|nr:unnamed protein product [Brassica napus]VDD38422.1 unnamed protein product [Brassica oleracea]